MHSPLNYTYVYVDAWPMQQYNNNITQRQLQVPIIICHIILFLNHLFPIAPPPLHAWLHQDPPSDSVPIP